MSSWTYDASTESNLMKVKYGKLIEKQFNQSSVVIARMKKKTNFVGSQLEVPVVQSIGGGRGAGSLPTASENKIGKATITSKKLYAVTSIDRESMKAARSEEGSFVRFTKFPVKIATESFNANLERQLVRGDASGSGELMAGHATNSNCSGVGSVADPYLIELDQASNYFPAEIECLEEGDLVNINSETTNLEVVAISSTVANGYVTATISLVGSSARMDVIGDTGTPAPFIASDKIYMQGSKDAEIVGIQGVLAATSGSVHGITVGRRWQSYQKDASSAALSTDLMNDVVMNVKRQCGKAPNLILTSFHQFIKLLNLFEDHKRYSVPARDKNLKSQIAFSAIEYISPDGVIPVLASRFIDSDKMLFLNDNQLELHLREDFQWFDEDGTVFLRESGDSYEARYGGYGNTFINPHFQGYLHSLAV